MPKHPEVAGRPRPPARTGTEPAGDPRDRRSGDEPAVGADAPETEETPEFADLAIEGVEPEPAAAPGSAARDADRQERRALTRVTADDSLQDACLKILRTQLARMATHDAGARSGEDPEDVHQMRVATRRARAAIRLFAGAFEGGELTALERGVRRTARKLGAIRDADVLLEGLEAYAGTLSAEDREGLEPIRAAWQHDRQRARTELVAELDSDEHKRFFKTAKRLVHGPAGARIVPGAPRTVRDRVGSLVFAAYERIGAFESVLPWADPLMLHDLRIATKRLRYTLEFFRDVLGSEVDALIERATQLQDHLGELHDADVGRTLARQILLEEAGSLTREQARAISGYLRARERDIAARRRRLPAVWRTVAGRPYRRRVARVVGGV